MISEQTRNSLLKRFLKYVKTYSESNGIIADEGTIPSTPQQWNMAKILVDELKSLGLRNVKTTDHCYTYGFLPATKGYEKEKCFCLLAHVDTVDEVSGKNVKPIVHEKFHGKKIELPSGAVIDAKSDRALFESAKKFETIITSDGSTLLGADDKAGVAEIITALEYIVSHKEIEHGPIEVVFSPDEETGHGMDYVPIKNLKSEFAYTVDGGHIGELEVECFNAYKSDVVFTGVSTHTGDARGKMVNAVTVASSFVDSLPKNQMPETTFGYEGFFAPMEISGTIEKASVALLLRDFDLKEMENRKKLVTTLAETTARVFGAKVEVTHTKQYMNMKKELDKKPNVVQKLVKAYKDAGVDPVFVPIRGGTDGSRLTEMGIPTPNIFTGGHNFHSRTEWASLEQMCAALTVIINLISVD